MTRSRWVATRWTTSRLLRERAEGRERVTYMELFFDLVYVFAITQLSRLLLEHLTLRGAAQTVLLLLAVWWAWVYTTWLTNWFDPNVRNVRLMLIAAMLISLMMSATVPRAFGDRGLYFALAYVAIQGGRVAWTVAAFGENPILRRNFQRVLAWFATSGVFWLAGGFAHGATREFLWLAAITIDYAGPAAGFYTPGLGRSTTMDWTIAGEHLAERCHLFVIVALGESILVTGVTFGETDLSPSVVAAFAVAFIGSVALWWIYFDQAAERGSEIIAASDDPGRLGRSAYTYFHLPIVAGIIVTAVGDELVIAHPLGETDTAATAVILGGPALFLAGHTLYKRAVFGGLSYPRLLAIAGLVALIPLGTVASPLVLAIAATVVIIGVPVWENRFHPAIPST